MEIPNLKFDGSKILSSTEILDLSKIPQNLAVVGGGYIGLELGTVYAKLGSNVSIMEMAGQLLPGFDKAIAEVIHKKLEKLKVKI